MAVLARQIAVLLRLMAVLVRLMVLLLKLIAPAKRLIRPGGHGQRTSILQCLVAPLWRPRTFR